MLRYDNLNKSYIKKEKTNNKNGLNSKRMGPILVKSSKNFISKNSKRNNNDLNRQYFHETNFENTKIGKCKILTPNLKRRNDEKTKSIKEYNQKLNKTINVEGKKKSKLSLNNKRKKELNYSFTNYKLPTTPQRKSSKSFYLITDIKKNDSKKLISNKKKII